MIPTLAFTRPRPPRHFGFTVRNANNDNRPSNATIVTAMKCSLCTKTHCACRGDALLGAA